MQTSTSRGSIGVYDPSQHHLNASDDSQFDFCNAFWGQGPTQRSHGATRDGDEEDWGKMAYDTVLTRVKQGTRTLDDLKQFYKDRASLEDEYAKRLARLSKHPLGQGETGHIDRAILQTKAEIDAMAKSHVDLASLMRTQEAQVGDFVAKREGARKSASHESHQANIEKLWKNINSQRAYVLKSKSKYEEDALQINALHAQASLLQGRDLDKATMKLDKVQQTVVVNERDYKNYVGVLKETTGAWNIAWKAFLDLCQDQEEERIEFVKGRLWDWANALSTVAMAEDESAERTRTALEQCDPTTDVKLFVQQFGTGSSIPDPLPFIDAKRGTGHKQQYKRAQFSRSSSRMPGVSHSPSTVDDIARAFSSTSIATQQQQAPQQQQPRQRTASTSNVHSNSQNAPPEGYVPMSQSSLSVGRPGSRGANMSAHSLVDVSNLPASQDTTPTKPKSAGEPGSARFTVSPSADLRSSVNRPSSQHLSSASGGGSSSSTSKPGHVTASAFQRSPSASPALPDSSNGSSPRKPYSVDIAQLQKQQRLSPTKFANDAEEDDDPLLRALNNLKNSPQPASPHALASPRSSTDLNRSTQRQSKQSFGAGAASASPSANLMQLPGQGPSRPSSRQGAATPNRFSMPASSTSTGLNEPRQQHVRSMSSHSIGHPDALRPHSPQPNPVRSSSPQPGAASNGFATGGVNGRFDRAVSPGYQQQQTRPRQPSYSASGVPGFGQAQQFAQAVSQAPVMPPQQHVYAPQQHITSPHQSVASYQASPAPSSFQSPLPVQQQQQTAYQQSPYHAVGTPTFARPPSVVASPVSYQQTPPQQVLGAYGSTQMAYGQQPMMHQASVPPPQINRTLSMHSGVSSAYGGAAPSGPPSAVSVASASHGQHLQQQQQHHQQHHQQQPQQQQQQQQQAYLATSPHQQRPPSVIGSVMPMQQQQQPYQQAPSPQQAPLVPPPTGQYTDEGRPILFYVSAMFDYQAASQEEFSFSQGDVIAVVETDADGWWQGRKVGDNAPIKLFPSNFTELLN
ncbi:formin-binding protein [Microbotryomycetes sp. JL221]|nr:formin-binding protein [Microbotryomycetes sp. JL221]